MKKSRAAVFFIAGILLSIILLAGCITDNPRPNVEQPAQSTQVSATPLQANENILSISEALKKIDAFVMPLKSDNLTYVGTSNKTNAILYEFSSDTAYFVINPMTGRIQSAKWTKTGPVISGISRDINESCERVREFAQEKYPEIWVSDGKRDMELKTAKKWPLGSDFSYECAWYEILYYPAKMTALPLIIRDRNSVDIVIDPYTGMISSYEETYIPLQSDLDLQPTLTEDQAWEYAKQHFAGKGVTGIQPSEQTSYGLYVSTTEDGKQFLIYSLKVEQNRNWTTGVLVGIDAHDGHVVYHGSF